MSKYTRLDFSESLDHVKLPSPPKAVLKAWGAVGDYAEWYGGFIMELQNGQFAYLSGWCDTTGWGCQDGASIKIGSKAEVLKFVEEAEIEAPWDDAPADLNKWIADGMPSEGKWD